MGQRPLHCREDASARRTGRSNLVALCLFALAATCCIAGAGAQTAARVHRVGVLMFTDMSPAFREAFVQGLREHGYQEGGNVVIDWRSADGNAERADALAAELVAGKAEVIVASLTGAARAAGRATQTIPIVIAPAGSGLVKNHARPEGNITGISGFSAELSGKRLEVLRELIPGLQLVAVVLNGEDMAFGKALLADSEVAARHLGMRIQAVTVPNAGDTGPTFAAMSKDGMGAAIIQPSLTIPLARARDIAGLALRHRIAVMSQSPEFVEAGGLASYGANFRQLYRYAASYVVKLLKGAKPGELPVERAGQLELVINAGTAKALGIRIPPALVLRADRVIE